jgi:soluble lytic murein transglycosylase-like protein
MSTQPIAGPTAGNATGALAANERVQRLQALIAQVENGAPAPSFATTLNAAQTGAATHSNPATAAYAPAEPSQTAYAGPADQNVYPASWYTASAPTALSAPGTTTGSGSGAYEPLIAQAAAQYGLDPAILHGLIEQESAFDPAARSGAGALGLTQLMPGTAASLGVTEPLNPAQSIAGGARYLSEMLQRFGGNTADALAAYNAGPGAVQSYGGVPPYPETQQYVSKVLGYAAAYRQTLPSMAATQVTAPSTTTAGSIA